MSFIGNAPAAIPTSFQAVQADSFNGNGSTTNFTLSRQITNLYDIEVLVDNVQQSPYDGSYSVNGTTITFSSAPGSGTNNIYIVYRDHPITSIQPKGDLTLEANLNVDGTVYANATLARDGGSDATINGVTPTSDNLMGRNRIINGAMMIDQRNAGASITVNSNTGTQFGVDRFLVQGTSSEGVFTAQQLSATPPTGFKNYVRIETTTASASPASGSLYAMSQIIEGFNIADLGFGAAGASTVTFSFWIRSSLTGTFSGSLKNGNAYNRSYPFTYTISAANTWEYKTVTVAGDTSGTWQTGNLGGLIVYWDLGCGSSLLSTANSWQGANYNGVTGSTRLISTLNATMDITGVQLEAGSVATSFERRPFGTELQLCQRYYEKSYALGTVPGTDTVTGLCQSLNGTDGNQVAGIRFLVPKRATPTGLFWSKSGTASSLSTTGYANAPNTGSWSTMGDPSEFGFRCIVGTGGLSNGTAYTWHYTASAEL